MADQRNEITFEITEQIGVIAQYPTGWTKELNMVSWNGGEPKYDIRDWNDEHDHMSRGITLTEENMNKIRNMMDERDRVQARNPMENAHVQTPKANKEKDWER